MTQELAVIERDDEIILSLVEQKAVLHDTVRIAVTVNAQRDVTTNEADMRTAIKATLQRFIQTDWRFIGVQRSRGQSRFEIVTVSAIARVPESENVQLIERANAAATTEIQLTGPVASYSLPFDKVQEINRDLRVALVAQARAECERLNKGNTGSQYRVGEIIFADTPVASGRAQNMRAGQTYANASASAYMASSSGPGEGDEGDEGAPDLGVTERFWVAAQVTMRARTE